jgi:hypothetical protein
LSVAEWQRVVLPYRVLMHDGISGLMMQAPAVTHVYRATGIVLYNGDFRKGDRSTYKHGDTLHFKAEPLVASGAIMQIDRCILLNKDGRVISDERNSPVHMDGTLGDSLQVTFTVPAEQFKDLFGEPVCGLAKRLH